MWNFTTVYRSGVSACNFILVPGNMLPFSLSCRHGIISCRSGKGQAQPNEDRKYKDLLEREPIRADVKEVCSFIEEMQQISPSLLNYRKKTLQEKFHSQNTEKKGKSSRSEQWIKTAGLLMLWDIIAIHAAYFLALWIRFDCRYSAIPKAVRHPVRSFHHDVLHSGGGDLLAFQALSKRLAICERR